MEDSCGLTNLKREDEMEGSGDNMQLPLEMSRHEMEVIKVLKPLPNPGKFMPLKKILKILRDDSENIHESVPPGEKNNVYLVLEDSVNALRRDANLPITYIDDYKGWKKRGSFRTMYVQFIGGKITQLENVRNMFCVTDRTLGCTKKPLNPQPDPKTLIRVNRYLNKLDNGLNRRITAVSGIGFMDRSLFEYCTRIQISSVTGKPIPKSLKHKVPEEDEESDSASSQDSDGGDGDDSRAPDIEKMQNDNQGKDMKDLNDHHLTNDIKIEINTSPQVHCEDLVMIAMLEENPSVQAVIHKKNELPSVILYNHKQLSDLKRNLECGSVMGIDCSYKIGDCYITMIVFQNSMALHKDTNEPLMSLGPMYLHWDEEFLTYTSFFSHLVDRLEGLKPNLEVKLGEEMDMFVFDALKHSFPTSLKLINMHHLKNLVDCDLRYIMPGRLKTRGDILNALFGLKGIISSLRLSVFEERMAELELFYVEFPHLEKYFDKLKPIMYRYVCEPQQRGMSPELWTNGNDEVLNDLLHTYIQHRAHKLPNIVDNLCKIIKLEIQYLEKLTGMPYQEWEID